MKARPSREPGRAEPASEAGLTTQRMPLRGVLPRMVRDGAFCGRVVL